MEKKERKRGDLSVPVVVQTFAVQTGQANPPFFFGEHAHHQHINPIDWLQWIFFVTYFTYAHRLGQ